MQSFPGETGGPTTSGQAPVWSGQQQWQAPVEQNENGPGQDETHEVYQQLRRVKISEEVIQRLKEIFAQNIMSEDELDMRAIEGLSEFTPEASMDILQQLSDSTLDTVRESGLKITI